MSQLSFSDSRLTGILPSILSGTVKALSLDVFDTLLARRVPRPSDVFLRLGVRLHSAGLLGPGLYPDSFAAIRYQSEYTARAQRQNFFGDREVTLAEIYQMLPRSAVKAAVDECVEAEIATEHELCFANPELIELAIFCKKRGLRIALISNSYLPKNELLRLVKAKAPSLPDIDGLFVSNEYRKGKRTGLIQVMLDAMEMPASACLHIGDDPISDRQSALDHGMPFLDYGIEDTFVSQLTDEHPGQWHERVRYFGSAQGDRGLTWLRRCASYWRPHDILKVDQPFYNYGAQTLGPLLCGFTGWVAARCSAEKNQRLFGLTREGDFLSSLVNLSDPNLISKPLFTSRLTAALASFSPDYPQHLEDFLTRRGHWTLESLMAQLGFSAEETKQIGDPSSTLAEQSPQNLTNTLITSRLAEPLYERSAQKRSRLVTHLKTIGALEQDQLYVMDLGYAATIQRALQRILMIEEIPVQTHGFYLAAAHVSLATQMSDAIVEGFLAQNGNPNDFARAFCRSPEVLELACMPTYATVIDYMADGSPLFAGEMITSRQHHEVKVVQKGILDFTKTFCQLNQNKQPDFVSCSWRAQMRAIAVRAIVYPTLEEAHLVGHWLADSDLGLSSPRPLLSAGSFKDKIGLMTSEDLINLPRRELPWLYGIAVTLSPALARQVASLMLKRERPEAFS